MSASHNPGGPKEDWGIKFNYSSGEPAPERITDAIYKYTQSIKELKQADIPDIDLSKIGNHEFGDFEVCCTYVLGENWRFTSLLWPSFSSTATGSRP